MRTTLFIPLLALIVSCTSVGHAPPTTPTTPTTPSPPEVVEAVPVPPEPPRLAAAELPLWLRDPSDDAMVEIVLRHAYVTSALVFVAVPPAESDVETAATGVAEAMDSRENMATSPMETGAHSGIAFAGFRTIETADDGTIFGGAVIVRQLPGSSHLAIVIGRWPVETSAMMLSEFQDAVSAIHVEGHPPSEQDFEDWFREEDPNVLQLPSP